MSSVLLFKPDAAFLHVMKLLKGPFLALSLLLSATRNGALATPLPSSEVTGLQLYHGVEKGAENVGSSGSSDSYNDGGDIHRSHITTKDKPTVAFSEAVRLFADKGVCGPLEYWRASPESIRGSGAEQFIRDWSREYEAGRYPECREAKLTQIQCFASLWWGVHDFSCRIDQIEQCSVVSECDIARWIHGKYGWPVERTIETAKKAYFIYKTFQNGLSDIKSDWV